jgi:GAF domain-containing protein
VIPFYQQLLGALGMPSLVGVPQVVRDEGIGELWFASYEANFFNQTDLQTLSTAAGQLAGVVEQSFLVAQTDESLRRQVDQLTSLTRISRELGTSLDLKSLLQLVYSEALRITRADGGSIILFDLSRPAGEPPIIRYSVGDSPSETLGTLEQQQWKLVKRSSCRILRVRNLPNPTPVWNPP